MDGSRFDHLVKSLGAARSRRSALGALAGVALAVLGLDQAQAHAKRSVGNACKLNSDCASNLCVQETPTRKICHCGSAADCPASTDQCRPAVCRPSGSCAAPIAVGLACDDGDKCTINDQCQADGRCRGVAKNCNDNNACTTDSCDPATGNCVFTPISCNDNNRCTIDTCDAVSGCIHTPVVCTTTNECYTAGACQAATGACSPETYHGDGTPCSTGVCHNGGCCTPDCAGKTCGADDGCGGACQTGACGVCQACANGTCAPVAPVCPVVLANANCGRNGNCFCTTSTEGNLVCVDSSTACVSLLQCTASSDCPPNNVCIDFGSRCPGDSCTNGLTVVCMPLCT